MKLYVGIDLIQWSYTLVRVVNVVRVVSVVRVVRVVIFRVVRVIALQLGYKKLKKRFLKNECHIYIWPFY